MCSPCSRYSSRQHVKRPSVDRSSVSVHQVKRSPSTIVRKAEWYVLRSSRSRCKAIDANTQQWFMFFQLFYVLSTVPIKASICVALLRITTSRAVRYILYTVIALATIACIVTDIAVLTWCRPVAATWDPSAGTCADASVITNVSYFISAVSILTDWTCAILPAYIRTSSCGFITRSSANDLSPSMGCSASIQNQGLGCHRLKLWLCVSSLGMQGPSGTLKLIISSTAQAQQPLFASNTS